MDVITSIQGCLHEDVFITRYVHHKLTSEVTRSLSGTSAHPTMVTPVNIMVMYGWLASFSLHVNQPSHSWDKAISNSDLETPRSRSLVWSKGKLYNWFSIQLICFLFISHQSDQQFLRYSYFEMWPWNIRGQGHEWGQRSRSHIIPSIQLMLLLFVSHKSDQLFLRYGQNSIRSWKNISKIVNSLKPSDAYMCQ